MLHEGILSVGLSERYLVIVREVQVVDAADEHR
jgi:hypothetical protein